MTAAPGTTLTGLVDEFDGQYAADPERADRALLAAAREVLEREILGAPNPLDSGAMRAAQRVCARLREREVLAALLARYLAQPLPDEEHAWARWLLVDNLALLRRHEEAVREQRDFLVWARAHLAPERLFWVMHDATQALSWAALGKADEWLAAVKELFASGRATADNREARFNCLRTGAAILARAGRTEEALEMAAAVGALSAEDPRWERAFEMGTEAATLRINAYQQGGRAEDVRRAGREATHVLTEHVARLGGASGLADPALRRRLATAAHNTAAPLYRARQYDLAVPLFRLALALEQGAASPLSAWPHAWLAASLWATARDRAAVLALLRAAAARFQGTGGRPWQTFRAYPEFGDVADDPEFAAAATVPS